MRLLFLFFFLVQSAGAQELVIVSPHWEGIRYEFEAGFAKWRSLKGLAPVKLSWRDVGGTSDIVRFVQSEYQGIDKTNPTGRSGIGVDIVFGGGIDPFVSFKKSGYLEKLEINSEVLGRVAKEVSGMPLYDPDGYWFSPTMAAFGIFCNQKVLKVLNLSQPDSWEDLLDPKMSGWIVSADPRRSGSAHMFYEIILQAYGWEKGWEVLRGLAANYRVFLSNSSQAILDVVNGEVACSFAIDSQANSQINRNPDGEFQFAARKQPPRMRHQAGQQTLGFRWQGE